MTTSRRQFLLGAAGACVPIPFLASLHGCKETETPEVGHPLVVVRPASGVAQARKGEPEMYWPRQHGRISPASLRGRDSDRIVSELADYADRLQLVSGTYFPFLATREEHAGGGNQLLTGAKMTPPTDHVMTYALGESIDTWIARQHPTVNGGEPLALYAGRRDDYGEEVLSYIGPEELRGAESDPWQVYRRLTGSDGGPAQRVAVNDLILEQLNTLRRSPRLSRADKRRLERHADSVREFELLNAELSDTIRKKMQAVSGKSHLDEHSLDVARRHCDLIALVLETGFVSAVTLQIGDRLDNASYTINDQLLPSYHSISHRNISDADLGQFADAQEMHAAINRMHLQVFAYLLKVLDERDLLDRSVVVNVSDVADGVHSYKNIPWIVAGRGDGTLKTGQYVDAGDIPHNRLLATLLTATGHRKKNGDPIEHFGDASLPKGLVSAMTS